jgi:hypothetical protein
MAFGKNAAKKIAPAVEPGSEYAAMNAAEVYEKGVEPPRGVHVLRLDEFFEHNGNKGTFGIFKFTCVESDNPKNEGREFNMVRNKYPTKGGIQQYFKTIKPVITAFLGVVPGSEEAKELDPHWGRIFGEILTKGTVDDKPLSDYHARVNVTPDSNPAYNRYTWEPALEA